MKIYKVSEISILFAQYNTLTDYQYPVCMSSNAVYMTEVVLSNQYLHPWVWYTGHWVISNCILGCSTHYPMHGVISNCIFGCGAHCTGHWEQRCCVHTVLHRLFSAALNTSLSALKGFIHTKIISSNRSSMPCRWVHKQLHLLLLISRPMQTLGLLCSYPQLTLWSPGAFRISNRASNHK